MIDKLLRLGAVAALLAACSTPPPPPPAEKPTPAVAHIDWFAYEGHDRVYDTIKAGPDEYLNPILPGFYPDPSVVRVGEDYYLVNSTFVFFPGLPIFHSRDLVHWKQIGNAIDRPTQLDFGRQEVARGLFAPSIAYHDGTYYIVNTCFFCGGNFVITASDPAGPWSDPVWLPFDEIDPSMFFDEDGKIYIANNGLPEGGKELYSGHRAIWMQEYNPAVKKMTGPRRMLVNGGIGFPEKKPTWLEGPHIYRVHGWYYLIAAEGGTGLVHSEVVYRSRKVWGPYTPYKGNPILTQRDLDPARAFPVTSTGHAAFVYIGPPSRSSQQQVRLRPSGSGATASARSASEGWWAVFLGTRPYGDDLYNTGRETFLLPVRWKHGWPVILPKGRQVPWAVKRPALPFDPSPQSSGNFSYREEFDGAKLGPEWLTVRTPHEQWYALENGALDLKARSVALGGFGQPSFIGRRQQHGDASVSIALSFAPGIDGERAGLAAFQNDIAFYFLGLVRQNGANKVCVSRRQSKDEPEHGVLLGCAPAEAGTVYLKMDVRGGAMDFFYGSAPGKWTALLRDADATILSSKKACCFVGTVIGLYAYSPD
jgi:xylan 1,4-beta-xylosidase